MWFERFIAKRVKEARRRFSGAEPGFCRPVSEDWYTLSAKPVFRRPSRVAPSVKRKRKPVSSVTLATSTVNEAAVREFVLFLALVAFPAVVLKTNYVPRQKVLEAINRVRWHLLHGFQRTARWILSRVARHFINGVFSLRASCPVQSV